MAGNGGRATTSAGFSCFYFCVSLTRLIAPLTFLSTITRIGVARLLGNVLF